MVLNFFSGIKHWFQLKTKDKSTPLKWLAIHNVNFFQICRLLMSCKSIFEYCNSVLLLCLLSD